VSACTEEQATGGVELQQLLVLYSSMLVAILGPSSAHASAYHEVQHLAVPDVMPQLNRLPSS
jgi:hypothetical protein